MKVERANDWGLEDLLTIADSPLVVLFVVSWYRKRDEVREEFERLARAYTEARFLIVDLLENPGLVDRFGLSRAPTMVIFINGREATRHAGPSLEQPVHRILGPEPPLEVADDDEAEFE